jgi:stress-induced morphogen
MGGVPGHAHLIFWEASSLPSTEVEESDTMLTPSDIEQRIITAMPGARVQVNDLTGGGDHYRVSVVAEQFRDQNPVNRHRIVYAVFKDVLGGELHALSLETITPEEFEQSSKNSPAGSSGSLPRL